MALILDSCSSLQEINPLFDPLFKEAGNRSVFLSRSWFELLVNHGFAKTPELLIYCVHENTQPILLLPLLSVGEPGKSGKLGMVRALSTYYSMEFSPLVGEGISTEKIGDSLALIAKDIFAPHKKIHSLELSPFIAHDDWFSQFQQALKINGAELDKSPLTINWYSDVRGIDVADYWQKLAPALRHTLARKQQAAENTGHLSFEIFNGPDGLTTAISQYQGIYHKSWKPPEPDGEFMSGFIKLCAKAGILRLGFLSLDGVPIAAQFWIMEGGTATIYKLAHDQKYNHLSPGTLLTWELMQHCLNNDEISKLSFGLGDDGYKPDWMPQSQQVMQYIAHNSRTLVGRYRYWRQRAKRRLKSPDK